MNSGASIHVISSEHWPRALDLLLARLPAEMRTAQRLGMLAGLNADPLQGHGLVGVFSDGTLTGVCWVQMQAGRVANLWPPMFIDDASSLMAANLIEKAIDFAISRRASLAQSLLLTDAGRDAELLGQAGFKHLADLLYLSSAREQFPNSQPTHDLRLISFSEAEPDRLSRILERTYEKTCDCPALNGVRSMDDVLEGYRAVGRFRPDLWLIAQSCNEDVGCLLLAHHAPEPLWELVYMGIVHEARGRGLGLAMTRYAQWLAVRENVERLVLAVDAGNKPAVAMYAAAGFACWDRRSVFMRLLRAPSMPS